MIDKTVPAAMATAPNLSSIASASRPHVTLRFVPRAQAILNRVHERGSRYCVSAAAYVRCAWPPLHARHA